MDALGLGHELQLYGDGAMFSYAVAVRDVWTFHWHNVSGRMSVFLLTLWPAETLVGITGNPLAGIFAYGFLFYVLPLIGLAATYAADPLDALLLQVQGSGRLVIGEANGSRRQVRVAYAGHNDQPYKSVGRWLIERYSS